MSKAGIKWKNILCVWVLVPVIVAIFLILMAIYCRIAGIGWNTTRSLPIGLYKRSVYKAIERGDIVAVCVSAAVSKEGLKHHYLSHGQCPGGSAPVLKKLIAIPGDRITLTSGGITVNDHFLMAPQKLYDHRGCPVVQFVEHGHFRTHRYWIYGDHAPLTSWDSRYFGGVDCSQILGIYHALFTFG